MRRFTLITRKPFGVATNPNLWFNRAVAYLEGDKENPVYFSMEASEMSMLKQASAILAMLHVTEAVTDAVAAKHEKGEHFTVGDLATVVAKEAVPAVTEAGVFDHPWRAAPPRRGGRKAKDANGATGPAQ